MDSAAKNVQESSFYGGGRLHRAIGNIVQIDSTLLDQEAFPIRTAAILADGHPPRTYFLSSSLLRHAGACNRSI
jgi:hypothetical protein